VDERAIIAERLRKKMSEVQSLEEKLRTAKVYVQALQDVMKALGGGVEDSSRVQRAPKAGSAVSLARQVILTAGKPVHISDLLTALGREETRETRASLTSSLAAYVRRGEVFSRPAPNTFGLIELGHEIAGREEPPEDFAASLPEDEEEIPF